MQALIKTILAMSRFERIALAVLGSLLAFSLLMLARSFYVNTTVKIPVPGGTYIEGSVGEVLPLNPWFVTTNDVNRDIISLIFSGLLKYDPRTGTIVDDLATLEVSKDNRTYTLTLKEGIEWHDSSPQNPHPVTADDVMYTFQTVQHEDFPNPILHQNFRGVEIQKVDDRTVRFKLSKAYVFFTSNLTLGLVPKAAFEGVNVRKLDQTLDFGLQPVGAGPYSFQSLVQTDLSTEVTLRRFQRPSFPEDKLERVVFRVFPDYTTLLSDIINLNGVRLVPRNKEGKPILPRRFTAVPYALPQYVGLFFNLDRGILEDRKLRLGLQLATDKQEIVDAINEVRVVDTPLLEIDLGDWRYKFDSRAAQGALFESDWNMPEKVRLQRQLERRDANRIGPLIVPPVALLETGALLTLTGSLPTGVGAVFLQGIPAQTGSITPLPETGTGTEMSWMVQLPASPSQSGSLKLGINLMKLTKTDGTVIDSAYIERVSDIAKFKSAMREQQLIDRFVASKKLSATDPKRLGVDDFYMDNGYLRLKTEQDKPHTRIDNTGKPLKLNILTSNKPETYATVANLIKKQWEAVGVEVQVDILDSRREFEQRLLKRDYDVVLFGQSLLDNLDSYPFWHSSQRQETGDEKKLKLDAFNLSQYASAEADSLLTRIRETGDEDKRDKLLKDLNTLIKRDVPAVFLYSPLYVFAFDDHIQGVDIGTLALHSDRFLGMDDWYLNTRREFPDGKNWLSFFAWLIGMRN